MVKLSHGPELARDRSLPGGVMVALAVLVRAIGVRIPAGQHMKISYRGGYNKRNPESLNNSTLPAHSDYVRAALSDGKKVAIITYAKPDHYYDDLVHEYFTDAVDIFGTDVLTPQWDMYDIIYILGGENVKLQRALKENDFSLDKLKPDVHLIGDSAGAMVLSAYLYTDSEDVQFQAGFNLDSKLITIVHADNPHYAPAELFPKVESFAKEHDLEVLVLKENEEVTY